MKILVALGTRPEAIKLAPLILLMRQRGLDVRIFFTQQQTQLVEDVFSLFSLKADYRCEKAAASFALSDQAAHYLQSASQVMDDIKPDMVIVQGDTTTAFSCALAAHYQSIPVGHVEAGLRTYDMYSPFPEENHRRMISLLSTLHFAPSPSTVAILRSEHIPDKQIFLTGNPVIDAVCWIKAHKPVASALDKIVFKTDERPYILATAHRRENFARLHARYFEQLDRFAQAHPQYRVVFVSHPNPQVNALSERSLKAENIQKINPLPYDQFIHLMSKAKLIVTDSGGVQEESGYLGIPALVIREHTERTELQLSGNVILIGAQTNKLFVELTRLTSDAQYYDHFAQHYSPYGTGAASEHICEAILTWWQQQQE